MKRCDFCLKEIVGEAAELTTTSGMRVMGQGVYHPECADEIEKLWAVADRRSQSLAREMRGTAEFVRQRQGARCHGLMARAAGMVGRSYHTRRRPVVPRPEAGSEGE